MIVPKVTLGKWRQEINEWLPSARLLTFYGPKDEREGMVKKLRGGQFDIVLTTFEMTMREKNELNKMQFEYLIFDEAQRIKND